MKHALLIRIILSAIEFFRVLSKNPLESRMTSKSMNQIVLQQFSKSVDTCIKFSSILTSRLFPSYASSIQIPKLQSSKRISEYSHVYFVPGFLLSEKDYSEYLQFIQEITGCEHIVGLSGSNDGNNDLNTDVTILTEKLLVECSSSLDSLQPSMLLIGHSRGGSVCVLALQKLSLALSSNNLRTPELAVILIDPVDSADLAVQQSLTNTIANIESSVKDHLNSISFHNLLLNSPILMFGMPYGGRSQYYRVLLDSVCAPVGRNADAFYHQYISFREQLRQYNIPMHRGSITQVGIPLAGHFQILDSAADDSSTSINDNLSRKERIIAGVCAKGEISDETVLSLLKCISYSWLALISTEKTINDSIIRDLKQSLLNEYPTIETRLEMYK